MILDIYTQDIYTSSFGFLLRKTEAREKKGGGGGNARHAAMTASPSAAVCNTLVSGNRVTEYLYLYLLYNLLHLFCNKCLPAFNLGNIKYCGLREEGSWETCSMAGPAFAYWASMIFVTFIIFYCA